LVKFGFYNCAITGVSGIIDKGNFANKKSQKPCSPH